MTIERSEIPSGFNTPTALPADPDQAALWQEANRSWWEAHPMRYDWEAPIPFPPQSREYFEEVDRRFFQASSEYLPFESLPFERLIPFDRLPDWDVLEIGVGQGSHAALLAGHSGSFTGIDLTRAAAEGTAARLRVLQLPGEVRQMDAEAMDFEDQSFDFIWSWGVIHHSSNTAKILSEMHRVLRPGGTAVTMVYHRNWWNYYFCSGLLFGVLRGQLLRGKSLSDILQMWTDGGLARFYTPAEWRQLVAPYFQVQRLQVLGNKAHLVPLPAGRLRRWAIRTTPAPVARAASSRLRMGTYLVTELVRKP